MLFELGVSSQRLDDESRLMISFPTVGAIFPRQAPGARHLVLIALAQIFQVRRSRKSVLPKARELSERAGFQTFRIWSSECTARSRRAVPKHNPCSTSLFFDRTIHFIRLHGRQVSRLARLPYPRLTFESFRTVAATRGRRGPLATSSARAGASPEGARYQRPLARRAQRRGPPGLKFRLEFCQSWGLRRRNLSVHALDPKFAAYNLHSCCLGVKAGLEVSVDQTYKEDVEAALNLITVLIPSASCLQHSAWNSSAVSFLTY